MEKSLSPWAGALGPAICALVLQSITLASPAAEIIRLKPGDSLQEAIDKAPEGAVIELESGTYAERISIQKPLTLRGIGAKRPVIKPTTLAPQMDFRKFSEFMENLRNITDKEKRTKAEIDFRLETQPPVVFAGPARGITLENLRISSPPAESDKISPIALVELKQADVVMRGCEVVGPWPNGIFVGTDTNFTMSDTFVSAMWGSGVTVFSPESEKNGTVSISNCEIRSCYNRGLSILPNTDVTIDGCRISGSAFYGILYTNASPAIRNNLIHGNARSGIYATGATAASVTGNVLWKNGENGMSCWHSNEDTITRNTFVDNGREGLAILGRSSPNVKSNILAGEKTAIVISLINSNQQTAKEFGKVTLSSNLFWQNDQIIKKASKTPGEPPQMITPDSSSILDTDPAFANRESGDFQLAPNSPAKKKGIGAANPPKAASPWETQGEELLILPDGDSLASDAWRRPSTQADAEILEAIRAASLQWFNGVGKIKDAKRRQLEIENMRENIERLLSESRPGN